MSKFHLKGLFFSGLMSISLLSNAQNDQVSLPISIQKVEESPEIITEDSIVLPEIDLSPKRIIDIRDNEAFTIIPATDAEIEERIKKIEGQMPMPYNEHLKKYIEYFLYKRPSFVKNMLEKKDLYFPVFEEYLAKQGIPDEMKYLSLLESGLNPTAVSRAKAVGLWQFMSYTGKEYGLRINDYVDERKHVEKSTQASFRYLDYLYRRFGDWELALASYNTGPGRISRAMKTAGSTDYWSLHNYIHPDTRAYVPQWAALNYLCTYAAEHGIYPDPKKTLKPIETENLLLNGPLNLKTFAELTCVDLAHLQFINPHVLKVELPEYARDVEIKIPRVNYAYFEANRDYILDSAAVISQTALPEMIAKEDGNGNSYHIEYEKTKKYHKVKSGEYLGKIASRYGVSQSDIKKWNKMKSSKVLRGQTLVIYDTKATRVYDQVNTPTVAKEKEPVADKNANLVAATIPQNQSRSNVKIITNDNRVVSANTAQSSKNDDNAEEEEVNVVTERSSKGSYHIESKQVKKYHFVKSGENLTSIARKYDTSISKLKDWNNLNGSNIMKGQKLTYYTTVNEKVYDRVATNSKKTSQIQAQMHVVQPGDTLWNISQRYGKTVEELKKINGLNDNTVKVGQKIKVQS